MKNLVFESGPFRSYNREEGFYFETFLQVQTQLLLRVLQISS
jgi:hypothetical protein